MPYCMDPRSLRLTQNAYFSLLKHAKQLLFVTFCDTNAGIGGSFWTDGNKGTDERAPDGQTDVEVEIVI